MVKKSTYRTVEEGIPGFDWEGCVNPVTEIKRRSSEAKRKEMSIAECFASVYGGTVNEEVAAEEEDNFTLYTGKFLYLNVDEITHRGLRLSSPYIKETIINKDNLAKSDAFKSYLLQNNNQVIGVVGEIHANDVRINVIDAYYRLWLREVEETYIKKEEPLTVYDLELTRGGFLGKVDISTLTQLTGTKYVNTCFIPGSQIVLNIERNFERWEGETVQVIPQKFTRFSTAYSRTDNCLLCSRKQYLQYQGNANMSELWSRKLLVEKTGGVYDSPTFEGTVTGVIKTAKKCGAFVELSGMNITGMLPCDTYELSQYVIGDVINVKIKEFEATSDKNFVKNKNGKIQWPNMRLVFERV